MRSANPSYLKYYVKSVLVYIFPAFGLNTEIQQVNISIQLEYGKIQIKKIAKLGHISRSGNKLLPSRKLHV